MTRFFFDFRQGDEIVPDSQGTEFADVEQAYLEVYKAAPDIWCELLKQRQDPRRCSFEVRDKAGEILFVFPLQEVLDSCKDRHVAPSQHMFHDLAVTRNYARRISEEFRHEVLNTRRVLQESKALLSDTAEGLGEHGSLSTRPTRYPASTSPK